MQKGTIKAIVLPVVFVLAVIIFSFMTNQTNEDLTTEMSEATLPVLTLYDGKTAINELYGYTEKMDAAYMRDTITPVGEDRLLPVTVKTYQTAVDKISYEIRSLDENNGCKMLGDIVISMERAQEQATLYGHPLQREVAFLTVHSMLHLLGYDHENGGLEAMRMREKEEAVLTQLGLPRTVSYTE